jgi:hypothetical protein
MGDQNSKDYQNQLDRLNRLDDLNNRWNPGFGQQQQQQQQQQEFGQQQQDGFSGFGSGEYISDTAGMEIFGGQNKPNLSQAKDVPIPTIDFSKLAGAPPG